MGRYRNGYDGFVVEGRGGEFGDDICNWVERSLGGRIYRGWRRPDGTWAGRVVDKDAKEIAWFDDPGDWQRPTRHAIEESFIQIDRATQRLAEVPVVHVSPEGREYTPTPFSKIPVRRDTLYGVSVLRPGALWDWGKAKLE